MMSRKNKIKDCYGEKGICLYEYPVMFISGEDDFIGPHQLVSDSFEKIKAPDKKIKLIRKAAHMCFFDQPDDFINEVVSFTDALK